MKKISTIVTLIVLMAIFFGCNNQEEKIVSVDDKFNSADSAGEQALVEYVLDGDTTDVFSTRIITIGEDENLCGYCSLREAIDAGVSLGLPTSAIKKGCKKIKNIQNVARGLELAREGYAIIVLVKKGDTFEQVRSKGRTLWNRIELL